MYCSKPSEQSMVSKFSAIKNKADIAMSLELKYHVKTGIDTKVIIPLITEPII